MPTGTYQPLATVTLGGVATSVTFSSIPTDGRYRDLVVVWNGTVSTGGPQLRLNGDTGSNYVFIGMDGSSAGGLPINGTITVALGANRSYSSGNTGIVIFQVMDSSATDKHKSILTRDTGNNAAHLSAIQNRWADTSAVTSLTCVNTTGDFNSGTVVSLYGIAS